MVFSMRKTAAILICKLANAVGRLIGRGSSKPGQLALKICPDILKRLKLPGTIVALTGSNGKTSTVEMIVRILEEDGRKVCWNKEGSNQIEGITTLLISNATISGHVKSEIAVMETDEQYARLAFKYIRPTHFVILNLLRDQLTRNGHPEYIYTKISEALYPGQKLILNADDPIVLLFAKFEYDVVWFGFSGQAAERLGGVGVYDDGAHCPECGGKMEYEYRCFGNFGKFRCPNCGHRRQDCDYEITGFDIESGDMVINGDISMKTGLKTAYHAYNMLAAFAVASELGVSPEISKKISDYLLKNGRVRSWELGSRKAVLLVSKHENSTSYNQSLEYAVRMGGDVLLIVDAISRKYFTGETSWLWDIDFDLFENERIGKIFIAGKYVYDLAARLDYTRIDKEKIVILKELDEIKTLLDGGSGSDLYVITCFSDREKFISRLPDCAAERSEV
jgi:UDP-N-acetylmuramyl tripeptide synthase